MATDQKKPKNKEPPNRKKMSYANAAKDTTELLRNYANIIERVRNERNRIEIRFKKLKDENVEKEQTGRLHYIDMETKGEYIFNHLKIKPDEVLELDLTSGRFNTKQILLKPEVDAEKFVSEFPDTFNGFEVTVNKLTINKTKVVFKFVPLRVLTKK